MLVTAPPVLAVLNGWEPTRPRLTWYGEDDERVELSGRVLTNWAVKAANLLITELDAGHGARVLLDLPAHWRLLVWALGTWATAAEVLTEAAPTASDVVVTSRPEHWKGTQDLVAVALPPLARAWPEPLPPGVIDGAAELMGQPDQPLFASPPPRAGSDDGARVLLVADRPGLLLERAWQCWESGGSVVVVSPRSGRTVADIASSEQAQQRPEPLREP